MTTPYSTAATRQKPSHTAELDRFFLDDEFDDFLDRQLYAIRETLADFRNI